MADLSITAANVVKGTNTVYEWGTAGATLTAGMALYRRASDSKYVGALHTSTQAASGYGVKVGIALCGAASGQPVAVATSGPVTIGATVAAGVPYFVGAAAGGICALADLASTEYTTYLGTGTTTAILDIKPHAPGAVIA